MHINLAHWRMEKGLSQLELSKRIGCARSYISEIENGLHDNIGAVLICRLCKELKCSPNDLIICEEGKHDTETL